MILSQAGYYWVRVRTIEAALNELNFNQIDAVLLAPNLPNADGMSLQRIIR